MHLILIILFFLFETLNANSSVQILNGPYKDEILINKNWEATVNIQGARGEFRNFIFRSSIPIESNMTWNWKDPRNRNIYPHLNVFLMNQVLINRSSYSSKRNFNVFDPLIPIDKQGVRHKKQKIKIEKLSHRESLSPVQTSKIFQVKNLNEISQEFPKINKRDSYFYYWIEVEIPRKIDKGVQSALININGQDISVELNVLDWEIPIEWSLPAYIELNPWYVSLAHYGGWDNREKQLSGNYFNMLRQHRFSTTKSWREFIKWTKEGIEKYLEANSSVFDSNMKEIAFDLPIQASDKPFNEHINDLKEMGKWVHSQKPRNYFTYFLDEPTPTQIQNSLSEISLIKKYSPELRIMVTTEPKTELNPFIDIFVPVMNYYKPSWQVPIGKELWWYISCMSHGCGEDDDPGVPDFVIDRPESYILSIGPLSWQKKIDGFLYFHANYNYQFAPKKDPWTDLFYFSGNGDGDLFYPGKPGTHGSTIHQPIPSVRLKLWRETSYLHQYLNYLQSLNPESTLLKEIHADFGSVFQWPRTIDYYINLKKRIFTELEKLLELKNKSTYKTH